MKLAALFGLVALLPAAAGGPAPALMPASLTVATRNCSGSPLTLAIPLRPDAPARNDGQPCCAKGCHVGGSRKRSTCAC